MGERRALIVRLGAMGDILHAMPAAAALQRGGYQLTWAVHPKWRDLLEGSGLVERLIFVDRRARGGLRRAWAELRASQFEVGVDFQGLVQSALVLRAARCGRRVGLGFGAARERVASWFYGERVTPAVAHVVERNFELAEASGGRGREFVTQLPPGRAEGALPEGRFVLAAPFAGWVSKQWPLERYAELALLVKERGLTLVLNGAEAQRATLAQVPGAWIHVSTVAGLIDATRRAAAVVGVDSGPLHLAAGLGRPGVAIFGPTDPVRNGPYGGTISVLRRRGSETTYRRGREIDAGMRSWQASEVWKELESKL